jgi:hypothetical protein
VYRVTQNDDYYWRSTLPMVGQLGKLRPIVNRPDRFVGETAAVANRRAGLPPAPHDLDNRQYFGRVTLAGLLSRNDAFADSIQHKLRGTR